MPCLECKSPTCHKRSCSRRPGGPAPKIEPPPKPPKSAPHRAVRLVPGEAASVAVHRLEDDQLIQFIDEARKELERRLPAAVEWVKKLEAAITPAAA